MRTSWSINGSGVLLVLLVLSSVVSAAQGAAPPQHVEDAFKNIKVLTGTPADQLFPTMQFFEASLGVGCDFCHNGPRDVDTARKARAREMVAMVRAINSGSFNGARVVTCYSCHRGNARPLGTPPPASAGVSGWSADSVNGTPDPAPVPGPPPADVLKKYVQSLGGDATLAKIATRLVKYTVTDTGGRVTNVERISKGDNGLVVTRGAMGDPMQYPEATMGWSGKVGWARSAFGVRDIREYEVPEAKLQDPLYVALHWNEILNGAESNRVRLGGQEVYQIRAQAFGQIPVVILFNENSGNLLRLTYSSETAIGQNVTQIDYSDFRSVLGTRIPFHWTVASSVGYSSINVADIAQNTPVDDSRFARPSR
jgi:hypothetical protein